MEERFELVLVKLVCKDIQAPDFAKYNFEEEYLAIKDAEDEIQPYGIIRNKNVNIGEILKEIKRYSNHTEAYDLEKARATSKILN